MLNGQQTVYVLKKGKNIMLKTSFLRAMKSVKKIQKTTKTELMQQNKQKISYEKMQRYCVKCLEKSGCSYWNLAKMNGVKFKFRSGKFFVRLRLVGFNTVDVVTAKQYINNTNNSIITTLPYLRRGWSYEAATQQFLISVNKILRKYQNSVARKQFRVV